MSDITFDFSQNNRMIVHNNEAEPWKVTLVDTGLHTMTGGRVKRIQKYVGNEPFMLTYGDAVSDVNIEELLSYHREHKKIATMTTVRVSQRFGILDVDESGIVREFREKADEDSDRINAGYMVLEPQIFDYISGDETVLEKDPLEALVKIGELAAYKHEGFWQCMDTQREKENLERAWASGKAPWKVWKG